ncbi:RcnB family protein [Sulfurisoma sediminicola]|uniref:Ni/Co efflux regulator RcnB n=1 Tax=Sulfurisoma sediminicola TaxID=1381557 RepID=A0A497XKT0_9PROT|nr:RcnB family protein [Sulfurisoma sediminicola]RLJ68593.1 Ni/Co efflux regulator RcnB [Sulfurisoma sediminicola]
MKPAFPTTILALAMAGILAAGPVMADKGNKGNSGNQRNEHRDDDRKSKGDNDRHASGSNRHFEERQQVLVREYYVEHYRGRSCPPGLAKKHNGCMPPGLAKKWKVGHPLPREVIFYDVPQPLVMQIGPPPSGHRYVRVAGDILLIAIGTGVVVDAINDLGGM